MADINDLRIDDSPEVSGRPRIIRLAVAFAALLAVAAGVVTVKQPGTETRGTKQTKTTVQAPANVSTAPRSGLTAGGYLEIIPPGPVVIAARVEGWVRQVEVVEGDTVALGQTLLVLDDTVHRQRLIGAEAAVKLARARLDRVKAGFRPEEIAAAEARLRQAEISKNRAAEELQRSGLLAEIGASPAKRLEESRAGFLSAEAEVSVVTAQLDRLRSGSRPEDVAVAQAELEQAEAALARARWAVDACVIRSPINGVVLDQSVSAGAWISPSFNNGGAGKLLTLFDPRDIQAWVEVNQRDADQIAVAQSVTLTADALRGREITGRVSRILPKASLQRNTIHVKIEIPEPPQGLLPEMSVQVNFQVD